MLKCEKLMQDDFLKFTDGKTYRLSKHTDLSSIVSFCFVKHLNNTLKEKDVFIKYVRHDFVLLFTVLVKREDKKVKIVDFAVSVNIDEDNDTYTVTDCYVTAWLNQELTCS